MFRRRIEESLKEWGHDDKRKPLILRGARQVGKTTVAREVGRLYFDNYIELNLEDRDILKHFRQEVGVGGFTEILRLIFDLDIRRPRTLLFIDEIQEAPWMITLLRFLYEKMPELAVLASGSLLEIKLKEEKLSVPVGRLTNFFIYPLNFFEFLSALQETKLLDYLSDVRVDSSIPMTIHETALSFFHRYIITGGMPELVAAYINQDSLKKLSAIKSDLITNYQDDIYKYASRSQLRYLEYVLEQAPLFAGTRYKYNKFGASNFSYREMKAAFSTLSRAMLLHEAGCTDKTTLPIIPQPKRQKKLSFLDVGLVSHAFGLSLQSPHFRELSELYRGQIAEQVVAQHLLAREHTKKDQLYYWAKQSTDGAAEVDYIFESKGQMVALEVKSGSAGKLLSLKNFGLANKDAVLVRVYSGSLKVEKLGELRLISIPFYLLPKLEQLIFES